MSARARSVTDFYLRSETARAKARTKPSSSLNWKEKPPVPTKERVLQAEQSVLLGGCHVAEPAGAMRGVAVERVQVCAAPLLSGS